MWECRFRRLWHEITFMASTDAQIDLLRRLAGGGTSDFEVRFRVKFRFERTGELFENDDLLGVWTDPEQAAETLSTRLDGRVVEPAALGGWSRLRGALLAGEYPVGQIGPATLIVGRDGDVAAVAQAVAGQNPSRLVEAVPAVVHRDGLAIGIGPMDTGRRHRVQTIAAIARSDRTECVAVSGSALLPVLLEASDRYIESQGELLRRLLTLTAATTAYLITGPTTVAIVDLLTGSTGQYWRSAPNDAQDSPRTRHLWPGRP